MSVSNRFSKVQSSSRVQVREGVSESPFILKERFLLPILKRLILIYVYPKHVQPGMSHELQPLLSSSPQQSEIKADQKETVSWFSAYLTKIQGLSLSSEQPICTLLDCSMYLRLAIPSEDILTSWLLSFIAIASLGLLQQYVLYDVGFLLVIGPWGAASVLLFAVPESPLCQPWNLIVGNFISTTIGISLAVLFRPYPELLWLKGMVVAIPFLWW